MAVGKCVTATIRPPDLLPDLTHDTGHTTRKLESSTIRFCDECDAVVQHLSRLSTCAEDQLGQSMVCTMSPQ
ncbi:hypothetical protein BaRGS_00023139 [Batillaria attramentaria]|uniref:Uncharacterized protein n=1 Tax=Batillaria attramentaria TaxID=370345 RepID=A0ABD0KFC9_9CAEN